MSGVSNWKPNRSAALDHSRSETREVGAQEPNPGSPGAQHSPETESRFRSRVERRAKKVRLPNQKLIRWEVWCSVHQIDFQDLVEDAIDLYMDQFEQFNLTGSLGAQEPTINNKDLTIKNDAGSLQSSFLDQDTGSPGAQLDPATAKANRILSFYAEKTGNQIKLRDRSVYENGNEDFPGVAAIAEHCIRYGIMTSLLICKSKVRGFAYCLGQIHRAADEGITADITKLFERTFDVRFEARNLRLDDDKPPQETAVAYEEYFQKLRRAANQPTLPSAGANMIEGDFQK